ncbi:hypothetical protein ACR3K2_19700 [Cryptosporidium serpentis]
MRSVDNNIAEGKCEGYPNSQSHWGGTLLAEATSKGPILFSGTDWAVVPLESLSPARRSIIHPISQRLTGVENTALVDGLFGRIWEFPKCENVRERKVTRGDQFVGDSRIDFQWNKTERTLCRVCGKHILKQKFATEHYQRSPTCWRQVMRHIGIPEFDGSHSTSVQSNSVANHLLYYPSSEISSYGSHSLTTNDNRNQGINLSITSYGNNKDIICDNSYNLNRNPKIQDSSGIVESHSQSGYIQGTRPTSNVEYIIQNGCINLFRSATQAVYDELMRYKGNELTGELSCSKNSQNNELKFDSPVVENVMIETKESTNIANLSVEEEPYLVISSVTPNIFPSINHRPLPVNVCYIKLSFNNPGARLVRDLWALDCELLVDWGDGILTQARRFTLRELGEPAESDPDMRNIYSQGFAYLKCFVPHKPPGRADLRVRIPKSLWEYWEAYTADKYQLVVYYFPDAFVSMLPGRIPRNGQVELNQEVGQITNYLSPNWTSGQYRDSTIKRSHPYSPDLSHRTSPTPSPRSVSNNNNTNSNSAIIPPQIIGSIDEKTSNSWSIGEGNIST